MDNGRDGETGERYYLSFIYVGSRFTFVMPIKRRSGVLNSVVVALKCSHITFSF